MAGTGGKREGAGRKKGIPNKRTAEVVAKIEAAGITPLEYLLTVVRDEKESRAVRMDAAGKAAPYVHPKLASTQTFVSGTLTLEKLVEAATNATGG